MDLVLTEDDEAPGTVVAHLRLDCPVVSDHRAKERPIFTLFGCRQPLPAYIKQHRCEDCG